MPLLGTSFDAAEGAYFKTLEELDVWAAIPRTQLQVVKYRSRPPTSDARGKLLVCHDYKGGYNESALALGYTFNFWSAVDVFIYFSHHRVTIPPPGWTSAAHRQGVKMLGTLIFEGGADNDCLRLLVGRLPQSQSNKSGPAQQSTDFRSLPLSPHYARLLADLALERGFDGYLLNFECPLRGGIEQTHSVAAWMTLLVSELKSKVGSHAEVIWYDSVVVNGQLAWQDRLNGFNLPFFLSSTGFFSNYTWPPSHISKMKEYLATVAQNDLTQHDIYIGIDVFGRGSHGGGGYGSYKALQHIAPAQFSTAFFAPGWTWESTQDAPTFTWESWFIDERKLWTGPRAGELVRLPDASPNRAGEPPCTHGPFEPISSFFEQRAPPDPRDIPLHTSFCTGSGRGWWVNGVRMFQRPQGWTDVDKQTSIGDLTWSLPAIAWEGDVIADTLPKVTPELTLDDAWNGGSSLRLQITAPGAAGDDAAFRCIWIPIQSVSITPQEWYEATVVYKLAVEDPNVDLDIALSIKNLDSPEDIFEVEPQAIESEFASLVNGWMQLRVRLNLATSAVGVTKAAFGLVVSIVSEDSSKPLDFSLLLGQLNAYPAPPVAAPAHKAMLLWADFTSSRAPNVPLDGTLTWETAATFAPLAGLTVSGAEDPTPAWPLVTNPNSDGRSWFPKFLYFNIYANASAQPTPQSSQWIGTSGSDGRGQAFVFSLKQANLENVVGAGVKAVTFYVQGVDDRGRVLSWDQCVCVSVNI